MDIVEINGIVYDVSVVELTETFTILYSDKTGRSISPGARMVLDPLGCFYGHKITFQRKKGKELDYDLLFEYVSQPRYTGVPVKIIHGQDTIEYEAYVSSGERALQHYDTRQNKAYWGQLSIEIIPMEAQVKP